MSGTTDYRAFLDKTGLTHFWHKIKEHLSVSKQQVQPGKQVSSVSQVDGKVVVEFSEFGGNTEEEKAAARESLGTIAAEELDVKADKVTGAVPGHIATLDAEGNIVDSGVFPVDTSGLTARVTFLENNMLQTKPEANNLGGHTLKLFRGPLPWAPQENRP